MRILFVARHFTYFRNFDSVISALAMRGHHVHLAADRDEAQGGETLVQALATKYPTVTVSGTPIRTHGRYTRVTRALRLGLDYLRYSDPRYDAMPRLRERARDRTPAFVLVLAWLPWVPWRRAVAWLLARVEEAIPRPVNVDAFVDQHRPDVLLLTPLIELGSPQLDYVRAARRLGVPSALCVWSWDHLSSKALIRVAPDRIFVWNHVQREEAGRFHGITADRVVVTGAQCFDRWFDRAPTGSRTEFCRRAGLLDDRPFVLYVCSALFRGSPSEAAFVREWVASIQASPDARQFNLLVRPHPQRLDEWRDAAPMDGVAISGSNPVNEQGRSDYFDSLFHCAAVVGLNTSALVEAAIVGRPVYSILRPEFRENQEGTFHFHHLLTVGEGFLHVARDLPAHAAQIAALAHGDITRRNQPFVERFIRPFGLASAATPRFTDAVEQLAAVVPARADGAGAFKTMLLRPFVYALVAATRMPLIERMFWNPMKFRKQEA